MIFTSYDRLKIAGQSQELFLSTLKPMSHLKVFFRKSPAQVTFSR